MSNPEGGKYLEPRGGTYIGTAVVGLGFAGICEVLSNDIFIQTIDSQEMDQVYLGGALLAGTAVTSFAVSTGMAARGVLLIKGGDKDSIVHLNPKKDEDSEVKCSAVLATVVAGTLSAGVLSDSNAIKAKAPILANAGYHAGGLFMLVAGASAVIAVKRGFL